MKKPKSKAIKKSSKNIASSQKTVDLVNPKNKINYQIIATYVGLLAIVLFSFHLRYEDFSEWEKNKPAFQYQGEYQMANFDSYFYLQAAKDLQNGTYKALNKNRGIPDGIEQPTIPPLSSMIVVGISKTTGIPFPLVAIYMPVVLASFLAVVVFFLCLKLNLNYISSLTAALFAIVSLVYVVRTRIGVFDTDSLNVIFPLINSYLLYSFIQIKNNKRFKYLILAALNTFLFFIWWNTAISVVILSFIIPLVVVVLFFFKTIKPILKYSVLGLIIITGLFFIKDQIISYFKLLFFKEATVFPNNIDIGELDAITATTFIEKTVDNSFIIILMLIGFVYFLYKNKLKTLIFLVPILLAVSPFFVGNRFIIFSAPIMAIAIGYFVQLFYDYRKNIKPAVAYLITAIVIAIGVFNNYSKITRGYKKTAAYENVALLNAIKNNTPEKAHIWTSIELGYQIPYYLDRGTFADGEFSDGERFYHLYFPLAATNLALSANYMQFYNAYGIKGLHNFYMLFSTVDEAFVFLKRVLSLKPSKAKIWLEKQQENSNLPVSDTLTSIDQWLEFLYPPQKDDIYLLIHYKMTQTAAWFKQGAANLKTGKTQGLPLFLTFKNLKEENGHIQNNEININMLDGKASYGSAKQSFQYILSYDGEETKKLNFRGKDNRFVFQWNKKVGFGAALSKEVGNATLTKLYLKNENSDYFESVVLRLPAYQIWKVRGDIYDKK